MNAFERKVKIIKELVLGDTSTYPLHMDDFHSLYGRYPDVSVCDAGYGSEENYLYAFRHGIACFVKYNYFHKEQKSNFRNNPFLKLLLL